MNWGEQSGSPAGRFLIRALYTYPLPACPKVQTRESVHGKTARQQTTKDKQKKTDIDHSEILFSADGNLRDSSGYPFCFFHFFFGRPGFSGYYAVLYRNVCAVSYPQEMVLAVCFLAVLFFLHCRRKKRIKKLKQMTEIVRQAAYGQTEPSEKETEFVRAVYCRTAEFLREKQRGFRKLRFRYTKAFY